MSISNTLKKLIKRFKAPTPEKWRKIGQRVLNWSMGIAVPPTILGYQTIACTIFVIGIIARALVEFTEDNVNDH